MMHDNFNLLLLFIMQFLCPSLEEKQKAEVEMLGIFYYSFITKYHSFLS